MLIAGVNLYALALVINALIGWPIWLSIVVSAAFVLAYITLGGLSGAIYNEVLQFFVIIAGLVPLVIIGLHSVGGYGGLKDKIAHTKLGASAFSTWGGVGIGHWANPLGDWIGIVMGLGFVLSFGYWTTNFAEVQRALSAKDLSAAQRTPLIGAFPKIFIPGLTVIPGLIALAVVPKLGAAKGALTYNNAIPLLMGKYLPNGALGVALAGLLAAFMAGMAANVSSFFNAPLFATFILAMFWKRSTPWAGIAGLAAGTIGAAAMHFGGYDIAYFYPHQVLDPTHATINAQMLNFYGAITAFVADLAVTVLVSLLTKAKPVAELGGLVWGVHDPDAPDPASVPKAPWWASPKMLGGVALGLVLVLSVIFA